MFFYLFIIFQVFHSVFCLISCFNSPWNKNSFDYLITADNIPSELKNCSLEKNVAKCAIEIFWQRDPDKSTIELVAEDTKKSASTDHSLFVNAGFENPGARPMWEKVVLYECTTDQCNSLNQLKRLLNSLKMNDSLYQLTYLLNPVKPFQGQWCYRGSNATFDECNITIPSSSCTRCTLSGMINQTRTELCATCSTDDFDKTGLSHGMIFNMTERTFSTTWLLNCGRENCNTPTVEAAQYLPQMYAAVLQSVSKVVEEINSNQVTLFFLNTDEIKTQIQPIHEELPDEILDLLTYNFYSIKSPQYLDLFIQRVTEHFILKENETSHDTIQKIETKTIQDTLKQLHGYICIFSSSIEQLMTENEINIGRKIKFYKKER
ncbi:unnamed protein product, partial [Rotaria sp. Silwood2]